MFEQRTKLKELNYSFSSRVLAKVFATFEKTAIMQCQFYTGQLPLKYILDLEFRSFINGLRYLKDSPAKLYKDWCGVNGGKSITSKYYIVCTDNSSTYRHKI